MSRLLCAECQEEGREEGCGMCRNSSSAQLRRLYSVICHGQTRSGDAKAIAQAIIDEYLSMGVDVEADMAALRARGDRLAEAALHITRSHDLSCTGKPCTCGLSELLAAIAEWESA